MPLLKLAPRAWPAWLNNPAPRLGEKAAFMLAGATALTSVGLSRLGVGFDGALDVFRSDTPLPLSQALAYQLVAWPVTSGVMWMSAVLFRGAHSFTVFLSAIGTARLPLLGVGVVGAMLPVPKSDGGTSVDWLEVLRLVLTAPLFVLFLVWLYQAFRHASRLSGVRLAVAFAVAVVIAVITAERLLQR